MGMGEDAVERRPGILVNVGHSNFLVLKLELLVFDEMKPRWWIRRCEKLFNIH